jgi:hypothetical protein
MKQNPKLTKIAKIPIIAKNLGPGLLSISMAPERFPMIYALMYQTQK